MQTTKTNWYIYALLLLLVYIAVYLLPLGWRPLMIPDEVRYAEIPREMLASGNWVTPHLNGLRYFEKPVLGYWLVAGSMQLFGDNAFAVRLPGALSAGLSALAIFLLVVHSGRSRKTALVAAMIYLTMFGVFLMGSYNILDNSFSFLLTVAFVAFYYAHYETQSRRRLLQLIWLGLFCGLAFLTKGFLAFALLGIVIMPYVIWQGRWKELFTRGWLPALVAIVVVLPWALLIEQREPDFWHYFFWVEHIKRFASDHAQHEEPAWFYLMFLPLLVWPWIAQLGTAIKGLWFLPQQADHRPTSCQDKNLTGYALLWFLLPFVFFSIAHGKLPTYILPCLPPLAILLACGLVDYLNDSAFRKEKSWFTAGAWSAATVLLTVVLFVVLQQNAAPAKPVWLESESWKGWLLCTAFFISAGLMVYSARKPATPHKTLSIFAISLLPVMLVTPFILPARTVASKMPGAFLLQNAWRVTPQTLLVADNDLIHAVNWYFKRSDAYMTSGGELSYGLSYADSAYRLLAGKKLAQFLSQHTNNPVVIVLHADNEQKIKHLMPPRAQRLHWGRFVLWHIPARAGKS